MIDHHTHIHTNIHRAGSMKKGFWGPPSEAKVELQLTLNHIMAHQQRVKDMKCVVENKLNPHAGNVRVNRKRMQQMEDRYHEIEAANKLLVSRMSRIHREQSKPPMSTGRGNAFTKGTLTSPGKRLGPKSLNLGYRKRMMEKINLENERLLSRIKKESSVYKREKWESDREKQKQYLALHKPRLSLLQIEREREVTSKSKEGSSTQTSSIKPETHVRGPLPDLIVKKTIEKSNNSNLVSSLLLSPAYSPIKSSDGGGERRDATEVTATPTYLVDEAITLDGSLHNARVYAKSKKLVFEISGTTGIDSDKVLSTSLYPADVKMLLSHRVDLFTSSQRKEICLALLEYIHIVTSSDGTKKLAFGKVSNRGVLNEDEEEVEGGGAVDLILNEVAGGEVEVVESRRRKRKRKEREMQDRGSGSGHVGDVKKIESKGEEESLKGDRDRHGDQGVQREVDSNRQDTLTVDGNEIDALMKEVKSLKVSVEIREKELREKLEADEKEKRERIESEERLKEKEKVDAEERLKEQEKIEAYQKGIQEAEEKLREVQRKEEEEKLKELQRKEEERIAAAAEEKFKEEERIAAEEKLKEQERIAEEEKFKEEERIVAEEKLKEQERIAEEEKLKEQERIAEEEKFKEKEVANMLRKEKEEQDAEGSLTFARSSNGTSKGDRFESIHHLSKELVDSVIESTLSSPTLSSLSSPSHFQDEVSLLGDQASAAVSLDVPVPSPSLVVEEEREEAIESQDYGSDFNDDDDPVVEDQDKASVTIKRDGGSSSMTTEMEKPASASGEDGGAVIGRTIERSSSLEKRMKKATPAVQQLQVIKSRSIISPESFDEDDYEEEKGEEIEMEDKEVTDQKMEEDRGTVHDSSDTDDAVVVQQAVSSGVFKKETSEDMEGIHDEVSHQLPCASEGNEEEKDDEDFNYF